MIRDITIGQYYPVESVVHRLDPRTKLFGTLIYIISLFFADNLLCYAAATVFLAMAVRASRVPFKFIVRGLKAIVFLLFISISFNLFLTNGRVIFQIGFLKVTHEGLRLAVFMGLRLMYLVIGSSVMTLTTTPNQLTDGLERSLGCLNRLHVPVILETDARSKCDKYVHLGMQLAGIRDIGEFGKLYDLIKYPKP